jgi:hypothetical protein
MRCTEVADRPVPDGEFFGRDIGDRGRYRDYSIHGMWLASWSR